MSCGGKVGKKGVCENICLGCGMKDCLLPSDYDCLNSRMCVHACVHTCMYVFIANMDIFVIV